MTLQYALQQSIVHKSMTSGQNIVWGDFEA